MRRDFTHDPILPHPIPKKLHLIWIGDACEQPDDCIESWQYNHFDWQFKLWTESDLLESDWINRDHILACAKARQWASAADLMRYEILYREGGVYADATSFSVRPLDDWLLENEMFACWRDTFAKGRARLVSARFLSSAPRTDFLSFLLQTIHDQDTPFSPWSLGRARMKLSNMLNRPWRPFGARLLTSCISTYGGEDGYYGISILPSQMFPRDAQARRASPGKGIVYAEPAGFLNAAEATSSACCLENRSRNLFVTG